VNQREAESDRDRGEALGSTGVGRPHDDDQEERGQHNLGDEARKQGIVIGRMQAVSVGSEAGVYVEAFFSAGDDKENACCGDRARDLGDHVRAQIGSREALAHNQPRLTAGFKWQPEMCPMA